METLKIDGCLASYEVTGDEVLTNELFAALVIESRKRSVLNLDVLLPTDRTSDRELLTNAGFTWAGTAQINRDGRAVTFIRFRTCVKSAGDGVATFGNTTLAPTSAEQIAVEEVRRRYSEPLSSEKLEALRQMGKQE